MSIDEKITIALLDIAAAIEHWAETPRTGREGLTLSTLLESHAQALHDLAAAIKAAARNAPKP